MAFPGRFPTLILVLVRIQAFFVKKIDNGAVVVVDRSTSVKLQAPQANKPPYGSVWVLSELELANTSPSTWL